jgi:hypothetical protein
MILSTRLKNLVTTFQTAIRKLAMKNLIDSLTRPPIGTSSMTTGSSGLALTEIQTIKPKKISNRESINSSGKYSTINRSTTIKSGSSSSSRTPLQLRLQHSLTARANLWDKLGLMLQNRCVLSDQQATCHHLRRNLFKPNQ